MIKVSIPAYKLRGESAFLECQYELNRTHHTVTGLQSHSDHAHGHNTHAGEFHYPDGDALEDERSSYRSRMRQSQRQHGQRPRQREPIAMRQYQSQQSHQQLPAPPEKSPYGHSVYRGSAASGYLGAAHVGASTHSGSVSVNNGNSNGVPAAYMPDFDRADSFDDSHDREEEEDEDEEEQPEEGEALYAIKWYKDNEEFYRYVPKARPPKTSYRVDGVRVIVSTPKVFKRNIQNKIKPLYF